MTAALALMLSALGGVGFTALCWSLFLVSDPAPWRKAFKVWRLRTTRRLRRYARRNLHRHPNRSDAAWWLAERFGSRS